MNHLLVDKANSQQIQSMLEEYGTMIKLAVDIRRHVLSGGGEMYVDCEQLLLQNGSEQDDIWGANWYPDEQRVEFEALINIRPSQDNRGMTIQNQQTREKVEQVTFNILGGVR